MPSWQIPTGTSIRTDSMVSDRRRRCHEFQVNKPALHAGDKVHTRNHLPIALRDCACLPRLRRRGPQSKRERRGRDMSEKYSNRGSARKTEHGGDRAGIRPDASKAQAAAGMDEVQASITPMVLVRSDTDIVFEYLPDCIEAKRPARRNPHGRDSS